jgi:hypothetical protein
MRSAPPALRPPSLSLSLWLNLVKALEVLNIKIMTEVQLAAVLEIQKTIGVSS